jgi:hypothetical protein
LVDHPGRQPDRQLVLLAQTARLASRCGKIDALARGVAPFGIGATTSFRAGLPALAYYRVPNNM